MQLSRRGKAILQMCLEHMEHQDRVQPISYKKKKTTSIMVRDTVEQMMLGYKEQTLTILQHKSEHLDSLTQHLQWRSLDRKHPAQEIESFNELQKALLYQIRSIEN